MKPIPRVLLTTLMASLALSLILMNGCSKSAPFQPINGIDINSSTLSSQCPTSVRKASTTSFTDTKPAIKMQMSERALQKFVLKNKIPHSTLDKGNGVNSKTSNASGGSSSVRVIPAGFKLAVTYDKQCLNSKRDALVSNKIGVENHIAFDQTVKRQVSQLELTKDISLDDLNQKINQNDCVISIAESGVVRALMTPNEPGFTRLTHLKTINAEKGWDTFLDNQKGITKDTVVAVVDTGVDYNHKDLSSNMWHDANNKYGYDFANKDDDPMDDHYHGTHVAGLIAATMNNGTGSVGVGGNHLKIMAVKTLGSDGSGTIPDVASGVYYAVDNGAKIINLSLGAPENSSLKLALEYALSHGVVVVMASGNDGISIDASTAKFPAAYAKDYLGAISVGSIDATTKVKSTFSNYNPTYIEIGAPGSDSSESTNQGLLSTVPGNMYAALSGTSQAAPLVAATAGLIYGILDSRGYTITPATIETILLGGSSSLKELTTYFKDGKMIDLQTLAIFIDTNYPFNGTINNSTQPPASPSVPCQ